MKRNYLNLAVGALLIVIFGFWLCFYQVRTTEVAVVTTFGKPTSNVSDPGLYFKWPPPFQYVHRFDKRIQTSVVESKFREDLTMDQNPLLTSVYIGWGITNAGVFLQKFPAGISAAEQQLENIVSSTKGNVIGRHPLSDFVSANGGGLKFASIENEILTVVQTQLKSDDYGIEVKFLGFKRIGLPEDTTSKVFDRMTNEREKLVSRAQNAGEAAANIIRSDAELRASKILTSAQSEALRIQGEGQAAAAKYLTVFQQNPGLASFIFRLDALEGSMKGATLILDPHTEPFTLFSGPITNSISK